MPDRIRHPTHLLLVLIATGTSDLLAQTPLRVRTGPSATLAKSMVVAPTSVGVTGDHQSATITWAAVPTASAYRVLKSPDPALPGQDLTAPTAATSYLDQTVTAGLTVYYTVIAVGPTGLTAASPPVSYTPTATLLRTTKPSYTRGVAPSAPAPPAAPAPVIPAGTSVLPAVGRPGETVRVMGQGFTALTAVRSGTAGLTWSPVSDTEISLTLPTDAGLYGVVPLAVSLHHNVAGVASGTIQPAPQVLYPPLVTGFSANWAECCETVAIYGRGLLVGPPSATIGGVSAAIMNVTNTGLAVRMPLLPTNDPGGPRTVTVRHAGGSADSPIPLTIVTGPSTITSVSPDVVPLNGSTQVTVTGTNLFRAVGICMPGFSRIVPRSDVNTHNRQAAVPSNDQMIITISRATDRNLTAVTGPLAVAVPSSVPTGMRRYHVGATSVCQANPTAVNFTVQ